MHSISVWWHRRRCSTTVLLVSPRAILFDSGIRCPVPCLTKRRYVCSLFFRLLLLTTRQCRPGATFLSRHRLVVVCVFHKGFRLRSVALEVHDDFVRQRFSLAKTFYYQVLPSWQCKLVECWRLLEIFDQKTASVCLPSNFMRQRETAGRAGGLAFKVCTRSHCVHMAIHNPMNRMIHHRWITIGDQPESREISDV